MGMDVPSISPWVEEVYNKAAWWNGGLETIEVPKIANTLSSYEIYIVNWLLNIKENGRFAAGRLPIHHVLYDHPTESKPHATSWSAILSKLHTDQFASSIQVVRAHYQIYKRILFVLAPTWVMMGLLILKLLMFR